MKLQTILVPLDARRSPKLHSRPPRTWRAA
jgi:hypothetical protein